MKIRIKGNSVRFRLSKTEVEQFGKDGHVEEQTQLASAVLTYKLERTEAKEMSADLANNTITLYLPTPLAKQWVETEKVGFDANMKLTDGNELYLLLEKDFQCLDNSIEDQSDNYENPLAAQFNQK